MVGTSNQSVPEMAIEILIMIDPSERLRFNQQISDAKIIGPIKFGSLALR